MCENGSSYLVFETYLPLMIWHSVLKSPLMIWNFKTHGVFYFVNFLCFYTRFFTHGFVFVFSILCFGFRFLLIYKWVMFQITKKQFLNCVPLKEIVILCIEVVMIVGMSSNFFCKHCITWLCFVLNPSGAWVPWNVGLCKD